MCSLTESIVGENVSSEILDTFIEKINVFNHKNDLVNLMYNTIKKNNDVYKNFFHGNDNYCYPLKGVLSYVDISAQALSMSNNRCEFYSKVVSCLDFNGSNIMNSFNVKLKVPLLRFNKSPLESI